MPQGADIITAVYPGVPNVYGASSRTTLESIPATYPT